MQYALYYSRTKVEGKAETPPSIFLLDKKAQWWSFKLLFNDIKSSVFRIHFCSRRRVSASLQELSITSPGHSLPSLTLHSSPDISFQGHLLQWHNLTTVTFSQQTCAKGIAKLWRKVLMASAALAKLHSKTPSSSHSSIYPALTPFVCSSSSISLTFNKFADGWWNE